MKLTYLQAPTEPWTEPLPKTEEYPRHWVTIVDIEVELSNGFILKVPKGEIWDGASIPRWLWWLYKPFDDGAFGDFIHDILWSSKADQLKYFEYRIYATRQFADAERVKWRHFLAPKKKLKTIVTNFVIRKIGGFFYSRQIQLLK